VQASTDNEADKLAKNLLSAPDDKWLQLLNELRDKKGALNTRALTLVAWKAEGIRRSEVREALAERLVRMTPATLRLMLKDTDAELRRAACLACAMRDDKQFIPDLIDRIPDASDVVVRAARAGLKSLTGADFGPQNAADQETKVAAAASWRAWYESQKR
jgi:hypothetical protein